VTQGGDTGSGRPRLDKLGVRPGMRVALVELDDGRFRAELGARRATVVDPPAAPLDLVFLWVGGPDDLRRVAEVRPLIRDTGAIWVLRAKGAARVVREVDVIDAGRAFDLVDNKIASFSDTVAAMRLVVPLDQRRG
jgi:hypothetical protein